MNKKCLGCGSILQNVDLSKSGYTSKDIESASYCQRCFKIRNYGEYNKAEEKKEEYLKIYKNINKSNDLVLFLVDIFNINNSLEIINKYLTNDIILVITKKDILPSSLKENKIKKFIKNYNLNKNIIDIVVISSNKNYNMDILYKKINENKKSKKVYVVGNTNAGKSTFINQMIYNYSINESSLTTSPLPSTTLKLNEVELNKDLVLIDTPGLIDEGAVYDLVSEKMLKKITPKKTIKPKTYQLSEGESIYAQDLFRLEYVKGEKNSFTIFISNDIIISRINTMTNKRGKELKLHKLKVLKNQDVMVNGLCFIKVIKEAIINIYTIENVEVAIRNSLI